MSLSAVALFLDIPRTFNRKPKRCYSLSNWYWSWEKRSSNYIMQWSINTSKEELNSAGLWLVGSCDGLTTVGYQRSSTVGVLCTEIRSYNRPLLRELHWLSYPLRIAYRLVVLAFRCQHSLGPSYLSNEIYRASDVYSIRRLRSASTVTLIVPRSKHSTIDDRTFPIAAAKVWNTLPIDVTLAPSLPFKRRLKTELFKRCHTHSSASNNYRVTLWFCASLCC